MTDASTYTVPVPENKAGMRLDRVLADALPGISRTRIRALIEAGRVVDRADARAAAAADERVRAGQVFTISVPAARPAAPEPQAMALDVVYEDDDVIVLDKPAGLVVHPAAGHPDGTLVNALLAHCAGTLSGVGGISRPGIVHRLDKGTSGLIVAAKNDAAHHGLARQFHDHTLERAYRAVVWGVPSPRRGEIAGNIGRSPANRKKMAVLARGGKPALTRYRVIRPVGTAAGLIECRLATGRTHQIRVHLASRGHPVVGDALYGGGVRGRLSAAPEAVRRAVGGLDHQALHAYLIGFRHPKTGQNLRFERINALYFNWLMALLESI